MMITRLPEALGLFTHEMGHLLGWDFEKVSNNDSYFSLSGMVDRKDYDTKLLNLPLSKNVKANFEFAESINNYYSTIMHSICCAIEIYHYSSKKSFLSILTKIMNIEITYSVFHAAKLLCKKGFISFDDFFNGDGKKEFDQNAFLFEYSIVRAMMFYNILNVDEYKNKMVKYLDALYDDRENLKEAINKCIDEAFAGDKNEKIR